MDLGGIILSKISQMEIHKHSYVKSNHNKMNKSTKQTHINRYRDQIDVYLREKGDKMGEGGVKYMVKDYFVVYTDVQL